MKLLAETITDLQHYNRADLQLMLKFYKASNINELAVKILQNTQHKKATLRAGIDPNMQGFTGKQILERLNETSFFKTDLSGADLTGAQLSGLKLERADFTNAILVGADLSGALLGYTDFKGADLRNANLSNVKKGYHRSSFIGANLQGADLSYGSFRGCSFSEADLRGADLTGADLESAWFEKTDVRGAIMVDANIHNIPNDGKNIITEKGRRLHWYTTAGPAISALAQRVEKLEEIVGSSKIQELEEKVSHLWYAPPGGGPGYQEGYESYTKHNKEN